MLSPLLWKELMRRQRAKITALHQSLTTLRANPRTEPAALAKLIAELTAEQDQVATFEASLLVLRRTKTKESMEIYLKGQRLYAQTMMVLAQGGDGFVQCLESEEGVETRQHVAHLKNSTLESLNNVSTVPSSLSPLPTLVL